MGESLHQATAGDSDWNQPARFPTTRYQGSKSKLVEWIWEQIAPLPFQSCLDAFGGTGALAYRLKQAGKSVTYNDLLRFNALIGKGLIENDDLRLSLDDIEWLLQRHAHIDYPSLVQDTFSGIYYTDEENAWVDQTVTNIRCLGQAQAGQAQVGQARAGQAYTGQAQDLPLPPARQALAFFALCQACIVKRPFNLFHRKNLYLRFAAVQRTFGNKTSWDRPFAEWFRTFATEANRAVFANGQVNRALNLDAVEVPGDYDLVYIDPPYLPSRGSGVDYRSFYHFLEGLADYESWGAQVDMRSKHRRLQPQPNDWNDRAHIHAAFERLFDRFRNSILVVSYRSDGVPSPDELAEMLKRYKRHVRMSGFRQYQYALSKNAASDEILLIGE